MQIGFFLSRFSTQKKKQHALLPFFSHKNSMLFKQELNRANWIFCPDFRLRKKTACITSIFLFFTQKLHVIQTRTESCKLDFFFPNSWLRKKMACITSIFFSHKNYMLFKKELNHANWIFLSRFPKKQNSMHYFHFFDTKSACYSNKN